MAFIMHLSSATAKRELGIANDRYEIPDDINGHNDDIAEMFVVK